MIRTLAITALALAPRVMRAAGDDLWETQLGVPGANGAVWTIAARGHHVYAAGTYSEIGGVSANNVALWDGTSWHVLGGGLTGGPLPEIHALAFIGNDLYVGGFFTQAGDVPANNIARWDGTNWSALGTGTSGGVRGGVRALAVVGEILYAGGSFETAGGNAARNVARWDGTNWSALGTGVTWPYSGPAVDSLAVSGSELYVGGRFRTAGSVAATNIAKWDGTQWSELGGGLRYYDGPGAENGVVRALACANGLLYAGGDFKMAGTTAATNLAVWDGIRWVQLGGGVQGLGSVNSLVFNQRELFVGGTFTNVGGVRANRVASWDQQGWSPLGSGVSELGRLGEGLLGLASTGSELVVGGVFSSAGRRTSTNIALWRIPHTLSIQRLQSDLRLSWSETGSNFVLETSSALGLDQASWLPVPQPPVLEKPIFQVGEWVVRDALGWTNQFYRLRRR